MSVMEVARQFKESPADYRGRGINRRFAITASAGIVLAAILGRTNRNERRFRNLTSMGGTKNSYRVVSEIERDYNEAISTITSNYSGDIDHEKATQAAIQGMLSTLDPDRKSTRLN